MPGAGFARRDMREGGAARTTQSRYDRCCHIGRSRSSTDPVRAGSAAVSNVLEMPVVRSASPGSIKLPRESCRFRGRGALADFDLVVTRLSRAEAAVAPPLATARPVGS